MRRCAVDTNVPIVANGRNDRSHGASTPTPECRMEAVRALMFLLRDGTVLMDSAGAIRTEYRRHLNPDGQPGVGDRFYQTVINNLGTKVENVELACTGNGEYHDFPADPELTKFDQSDRKFAALSIRAKAPVLVATDSDWVNYKKPLSANGVKVKFLCGCDPILWFNR